ncbi:MAG: Nif3-like dinuclear metal center hexameric protein [Victivallales bacterium]|nr:Nif3-like dinuclear metal center hexameric protein [Victivallales bacterium]
MVMLNDLKTYLDELLQLDKFPGDCSNNGLQVEGAQEISRIVFGVDACAALFAAAADSDAEFIFVHHGLSWGNGFKYFTGNTADRLKLLFCNDISLYAVHLPLDAHPQYGHNAVLADMVELDNRSMFCEYAGTEIGVRGSLPQSMTPDALAQIFAAKLDCQYTIYPEAREKSVKHIGIVSGGAGIDGIEAAAECGLDCLITGEMEHQCYHAMLERNMPVIALGHYKSETPGVLKVMELIKQNFDVECHFADLPTGL